MGVLSTSPDEEHDPYIPAPITYTSLHSVHLNQVNDLLARNFWKNINSSS
jgi:hypothetical protein